MFIIFVEKLFVMVRQKKHRLIQRAPSFGGFIPYGMQHTSSGEVNLTFEEYESFTLCDYELLKHEEAAQLMGVSRPTFTRIYSSARKKLAQALVEVAAIRIGGGRIEMATSWFHCLDCDVDFNSDSDKEVRCPLCSGGRINKNW